jgi:hypothetical protein
MTNKDIRKLREKVASLSSGRYYDQIAHWFDLLDQVVQDVSDGELGMGDRYPSVFNSEGYMMTQIGDSDLYVWWSYYRMPSNRWEIVCYLT